MELDIIFFGWEEAELKICQKSQKVKFLVGRSSLRCFKYCNLWEVYCYNIVIKVKLLLLSFSIWLLFLTLPVSGKGFQLVHQASVYTLSLHLTPIGVLHTKELKDNSSISHCFRSTSASITLRFLLYMKKILL